jgi:3-dehydroquinate dehydratase-2
MKHRILFINGPNLNLTGTRQPEIYGSVSFDSFLIALQNDYPALSLEYIQSNHEGPIIDAIQGASSAFAGVLINAGGYTHTSVAIADALAACSIPVIEVHMSNIIAREPHRNNSLLASYCKGSICGFGLLSYTLGIEALLNIIKADTL